MHTTTKASQTVCVWNLATVTGCWMHKDQKQTQNQCAMNPRCSWQGLPTLHHVTSVALIPQKDHLHFTLHTLTCLMTTTNAAWHSLARLDTTSSYELHCFHCTENVFLLSQKHNGLIPNSQDFESVPTSHHFQKLWLWNVSSCVNTNLISVQIGLHL